MPEHTAYQENLPYVDIFTIAIVIGGEIGGRGGRGEEEGVRGDEHPHIQSLANDLTENGFQKSSDALSENLNIFWEACPQTPLGDCKISPL